MPWEKTFNVEKAIGDAMLLFWKNGYAGSSMADLLETTGLTKGSFYNAFGSKQDLFVQTLQKYDQATRSFLGELIALDSPSAAVDIFFNGLIQSTVSDEDRKGCYFVNMMPSISSFNDEIQEVVKASVKSVEVFLKQMVELGQIRGEFNKEISAEAAGKALFATMVSIRVLGRGIFEIEELKMLVEQSLSLVRCKSNTSSA